MPKFKIIVTRSGHIFDVDGVQKGGSYNHPTVNGKYMYLTDYWGLGDTIYEIKKLEDIDIEIEDKSMQPVDTSQIRLGTFN